MPLPTLFRKNVADSSAVSQIASPRYEYSRLPDPQQYVRLLKASRNLTQDSHEYDLEIFPIARLFDHPGKLTYYAISYEWGPPSSSAKSIIVNSRRLSIRQNLYDFLQRIQDKIRAGTFSPDYWLWIDAICINQDWGKEKAHQIPLMQLIFSNATFVFAWLGPGSCFDARNFKRDILDITEGIDEKWFSRVDTTDESDHPITLAKRQEVLEKVAGLLETDFHDELILTLSLSFWSRRWILQEMALAWSVVMMCGDVEIRWSDMKKLFSVLRFYFQYRDDNPLQKSLAWRLWELENANLIQCEPKTNYVHQLKTILTALSDSECELDVDRIYVVLNLMSSQSSAGPEYIDSASRFFCSVYAKHADFDLESLLSSVSLNPSESTEFKQRAQDWLVVAQELRLLSLDHAGHFQMSPYITGIVRYSQSMEYIHHILLGNEVLRHPDSQELTVTIQSTGLAKILPASTVSVQIGRRANCLHRTTSSATSMYQIATQYANQTSRTASTDRIISSTETHENALHRASVDRTIITYRLCGRDTVDALVNVTISCRDESGVINECSVNQGSMKCDAEPGQGLYLPPGT